MIPKALVVFYFLLFFLIFSFSLRLCQLPEQKEEEKKVSEVENPSPPPILLKETKVFKGKSHHYEVSQSLKKQVPSLKRCVSEKEGKGKKILVQIQFNKEGRVESVFFLESDFFKEKVRKCFIKELQKVRISPQEKNISVISPISFH